MGTGVLKTITKFAEKFLGRGPFWFYYEEIILIGLIAA